MLPFVKMNLRTKVFCLIVSIFVDVNIAKICEICAIIKEKVKMLTHNTTKIDTPIKLIIKINIVANEEGFIFIKWTLLVMSIL